MFRLFFFSLVWTEGIEMKFVLILFHLIASGRQYCIMVEWPVLDIQTTSPNLSGSQICYLCHPGQSFNLRLTEGKSLNLRLSCFTLEKTLNKWEVICKERNCLLKDTSSSYFLGITVICNFCQATSQMILKNICSLHITVLMDFHPLTK
jgi:hypothetical protein